jgi:DNA-binding GntR family transcriptional regulator
MGFENITLSQRISGEIAMKISEGMIKPGERLLENDLLKQFGTSRAPIREALFILEKDGVVERIPRRGVFVKKRTKKELKDLYGTVYGLLEIALKKVIDLYSNKELDELCNLIEKMEDTIEEKKVKRCFELLEEFQLRLFEISNNLVLRDLYLKINTSLMSFRYISLSYPSSLERSVEEYREIVKGLEMKDIDKVLTSLKKKETRALSILEKIVED